MDAGSQGQLSETVGRIDSRLDALKSTAGHRIRDLALAALPLLTAIGVAFLTVSCTSDDCAVVSTCLGGVQSDPQGGVADSGAVDPTTESGDGRFEFESIPPQPRVVHATSAEVKLAIKRDSGLGDDIVVKVSSLPPGVSVEPLTIRANEAVGLLTVHVADNTNQGSFEAVVEGTSTRHQATTRLTLFVRGKPGTIDTTFGSGGRQLSVLGAGNYPPRSVLVGAADKIIVVSSCPAGTCAARLDTDGTRDTMWAGGLASINLKPSAVALDSAGRLIVAGGDNFPVVGRLLATGQVDSSFASSEGGTGGVTANLQSGDPAFSPPDGAYGLTIGQGDVLYAAFPAGRYIGIRKLDSNGNRVPAFGGTGVAHITWSSSSRLAGISAHDGKVTVTGSWKYTDGPAAYGIGIAQYDGSTGNLNLSFSGNGFETFARPTEAFPIAGALLHLPDGRSLSGLGDVEGQLTYNLTMFTAGGTLDTTFGNQGRAVLPGQPSGGHSLARQADGRLLVALRHGNGEKLIRLTSTGGLDPTFADGGVFSATFGDESYCVALQSDGRILLGSSNTDKTSYITRIWD